MKYQNKTFTVPYTSKQYRNNWDSVFNTLNYKVGDLVAVEEYCGNWCGDKWFEEEYPSFWFGVVEKIEDVSLFEDDPDCVVKVTLFNSESTTMGWEWVNKNNVCLIRKDIYSFLRKEIFSDDEGKEKGVSED